MLGGIVDLILGTLIVLGWPESSVWVIGLFVGIELVFYGVLILADGRSSRALPGAA